MLFPVCTGCLSSSQNLKKTSSMPLAIEPDCVPDVYKHISVADFQSERENLACHRGILYNESASAQKKSKSKAGKALCPRGSFDYVHVLDVLSLWPTPSEAKKHEGTRGE